MKFIPSIERLLVGAWGALKRFPASFLCAVVGSIVAAILAERQGVDEPRELTNLIATAALGLPLFFAMTVVAEKRVWAIRSRLITHFIGIVALVFYYFSLPIGPFAQENHIIRFIILNLGLHFLVAVAPYVGNKQESGFWQYNKTLLLNFLTSAFYSAALFIGFVIALAATDYLFGAKIDGNTYFELWIVMAGIVNTWIFLAIVPKDLHALEHSEDYPGALKVFSQYVLLPLVGLYFVILISYEAKIIFLWSWPKGLVSQLILTYSVIGILSLLLLHPLKDRAGSKWIGRFVDWFFRLLIPLVIMLFFAIRRRISEYGVTEPRYVVLILAIGLCLVLMYFLFSKRKDIRIIPIVLVLLAVVSAYGPLSASSISLWSQTSRLDALLVETGLLKDGKLQKISDKLPADKSQQMSSIVDYLIESHGPKALQLWLSDSAVTDLEQRYESTELRRTIRDTAAAQLGFEFVWQRTDWETSDGDQKLRVSVTTEKSRPINVSGFDHMFYYEYTDGLAPGSFSTYFSLPDFTCLVSVLPQSSIVSISFTSTIDTIAKNIRLELLPRVRQMDVTYHGLLVPQDSLMFDGSIDKFDVRLQLTGFHGEERDSILETTYLNSRILVRKRP